MKKKIVGLSVVALLIVVVISAVIYQWPRDKTMTYENVALYYTKQEDGRFSDFQSDYATVDLSITQRRRLTAPTTYSGTITINGLEYSILDHDYGDFWNAWQEKDNQNKRAFIQLYARIEELKETESGVFMPIPKAVVTMYVSKDFNMFYLLENPQVNISVTNCYIYPASSAEEARAVYDALS